MGVLVCHPGARTRWPRHGEAAPIVIGLVNNMPDAALRATERQFLELLTAASGDRAVRLRLLYVPEVPRAEAGRAHVSEHYESIDELWDGHLDGLIVTGSEPRARVLQDEPFWPTLARLTDWAEEHTVSTVWSCLAAQIAVLRSAGIVRRPFGWKLCGVFDCVKATEHALTAGFPRRWRVPQTRYNDLPEAALAASGYRILSHMPDAGADLFAGEGKSLFLFVQGHPEYDAEALFREYRRDIGRFLAGERDTYPDPMRGYFDEATTAALDAFRLRALGARDPALLLSLPAALAGWRPSHSWRGSAVRLYTNWLSYLFAHRSRRRAPMLPRPATNRPCALSETP